MAACMVGRCGACCCAPVVLLSTLVLHWWRLRVDARRREGRVVARQHRGCGGWLWQCLVFSASGMWQQKLHWWWKEL
jgi:hypothetical protein